MNAPYKTLTRYLCVLFLAFFMQEPTQGKSPLDLLPNRGIASGNTAQSAILARKGWIRVYVGSSLSAQVRVSGDGYQVLIDGHSAGSGRGNATVTGRGDNVVVSQGRQNIASGHEVTIVPTLKNGIVGIGEHNYRGRLVAIASGKGISLVNEVMIDDFLKGMLDAEIGGDAPMEALKAQAICARSELIRKLVKPPHRVNGYDFCNSTHCMVYKGISAENTACVQAVNETLGLALIANGNVLDAVFHNVCGGTTAGAEEVWDSDPVEGLVPVLDNGHGRSAPNLSNDRDAASFINSADSSLCCHPSNPTYPNYAKKYFRWEKNMSAEQVARIAGVGSLRDIRVIQRMPSGRVRKLQVTGTRGAKVFEKEFPIRNAFDLWSGFFVVDMNSNGVTFRGAGNGHGVGLCQMGARSMAARGAKYTQILKNYFPQASIQRIYKP